MTSPLRSLALTLLCTALVGCESLSDATSSVRDRLTTREEPRTKVYAASARATYDAARAAAEKMGYRITRGAAAQGEIEAVSGLLGGDVPRDRRQITMSVRLRETLDGTEVKIGLMEVIESPSAGGSGASGGAAALPTRTPLRDTPQYEVFFRYVQQALDSPASK